MSIPKAMQGRYDQIAAPIEAFCRERLDEDHLALCLHLLEKLCRKRPSPLLSGKAETWAAGIVYAIAANNFIFDKENPHYMTAQDLAKPFGLATSTASNKAAQLRKMFNISPIDSQWVLPRLVDESIALWMIRVNGIVVDARSMPLEVQQIAFEKGLIPYLPGEERP